MFLMFFDIFDIDSLAVFSKHLYLIVSDSVRENELVTSSCHRIFHGYAELIDAYYDRTDYCNQGQWLSCSVKHSCADLCVAYSHVP